MNRGTEGYTCRLVADGQWEITDRFSNAVAGEARLETHREARRRADELNERLVARRFRS